MFVVNSPVCVVCGNHTVFFLSDEERAAMNSGKLIQDALPDWTAEQREVLISGTHPKCWLALYQENACEDCGQANYVCTHGGNDEQI